MILSPGALNRCTLQTLASKIVYSNINTSPIIPKPLNKKKLKELFSYLMDVSTSLNIPEDTSREI